MPYAEVNPSVAEDFAYTLAEHNLHTLVAGEDEFAAYKSAMIEFFYDNREPMPDFDIEYYVHDHCHSVDGFRAAMVLDEHDAIVGTHWSESIGRAEAQGLSPLIRKFLGLEQLRRPDVEFEYALGAELLVRPDLRGKGLGAGLRALTQTAIREAATVPTLLLSTITVGDKASEATALRVGHAPTGIHYQPREGLQRLQYWYGLLEPGRQQPSEVGNGEPDLI